MSITQGAVTGWDDADQLLQFAGLDSKTWTALSGAHNEPLKMLSDTEEGLWLLSESRGGAVRTHAVEFVPNDRIVRAELNMPHHGRYDFTNASDRLAVTELSIVVCGVGAAEETTVRIDRDSMLGRVSDEAAGRLLETMFGLCRHFADVGVSVRVERSTGLFR
ncbi:MAG: hypothetical protein HGA39_01425 [Coriobacteriia bacterium]|nr:hypothetical protein [Coriobacteriia bacterium]